MKRWTVVTITSFVLIALVSPLHTGAAELKPMMAGWERYFTITWEPAQSRGKSILQGYVSNTSPYDMHSLRLLVETLDAAGETTSQRVAYVPGSVLGGARLYWEAPVEPAPTYRVRVFSYERMELPSIIK